LRLTRSFPARLLSDHPTSDDNEPGVVDTRQAGGADMTKDKQVRPQQEHAQRKASS